MKYAGGYNTYQANSGLHDIVSSKLFSEIGYSTMEPINDNQRIIAATIDRLSTEKNLTPSAITQVVNALNFLMTRADSEFLAAYIRWRMENPLAK